LPILLHAKLKTPALPGVRSGDVSMKAKGEAASVQELLSKFGLPKNDDYER